jgi:hypothetical protein
MTVSHFKYKLTLFIFCQEYVYKHVSIMWSKGRDPFGSPVQVQYTTHTYYHK